ncbi:MAG: formylmethanofuran dehydrogenase subunit E family protein [Chthonomonadales bacterium]
MNSEMDWDSVRRLHGHLGPWLALGIRIGQAGMQILNARPHFGIRINVRCPLAPPPSCMLDGLQWSTGATYGKQNLTAEPGEPILVRMQNTDTGAALAATLADGLPGTISRWLDELGDEGATFQLWETPDSELFHITNEAASAQPNNAMQGTP